MSIKAGRHRTGNHIGPGSYPGWASSNAHNEAMVMTDGIDDDTLAREEARK